MTDRIKVGDVYLELPKGALKPAIPVAAEKSDVPDALEPPVFFTPRVDPVQEYLAKAAAPSAQSAAERTPAKQPDQMDEWVAFCGEAKMPQRWLHYQEKTANNCGFNWFAFLFGVQWFFLHRMYANGILSLVCEFVPVAGFVAIASSVTSSSHAMGGLVMCSAFVIGLGVRVAIGYWANIARYGRAIREIENARALGLQPDMHLAVIRTAGSASMGAVLLLNSACVVLRMLVLASS